MIALHEVSPLCWKAFSMVCAAQPLAVQIGIDILKKGGNAIDAAIAVNAALGLMEPVSCGIGGDLFAIVWDARKQRLYGLNASGRSPSLLTIEEVKKGGMLSTKARSQRR